MTSTTVEDMYTPVADDYVPVVDDHGVLLLAPEEEPVMEDTEHRLIAERLHAGLRAKFRDHPDVAVFCSLAWFPDVDDTTVRIGPDIMVVFGRPQHHRRSYRAWAEEGVVPAVLVEVYSEHARRSDYRRRLAVARRYGVGEIVLIDPLAPGGVDVRHLRPSEDGEVWTTVAVSADGTRVPIDTLGIWLAGGVSFEVGDDRGMWPEAFEAVHHALSLRNRAEQEATRAEQEATRAERLAAQLRAAGIDPEV